MHADTFSKMEESQGLRFDLSDALPFLIASSHFRVRSVS